MNRYEDFDLGKFNTVYDIKPDTLAHGFFLQMRALLEQRKYLRHKYDGQGKIIGFQRDEPKYLAEADAIAYEGEMKLRDDDQGSTWLAGIIVQRKKLLQKEEDMAWKAWKQSTAFEDMLEQRRKDDCEFAMAQSEKRDLARERKQERQNNRVCLANAWVKVFVYKRRKRREYSQVR
jgi:hypothetical protein